MALYVSVAMKAVGSSRHQMTIGCVVVLLSFNGVVTEIEGCLALWISSAVAILPLSFAE